MSDVNKCIIKADVKNDNPCNIIVTTDIKILISLLVWTIGPTNTLWSNNNTFDYILGRCD